MTKPFLYFVLIIIFSNVAVAQTASELNEQSKTLLEKNDYQNALPILRKAAEAGSAEAQYNLGYFLQHGINGMKDEKEALNWYKTASDNGYNNGHYAAMMAYAEGMGTTVNYEKAFEYALKCASNNDATCIWNVVNCYLQGMGTEKSIPKMLEWATRLAKLENPKNLALSGNITSCRLELAKWYSNGQYVDKNLYKAYLWYLIYNESKRDFSVMQQESVITDIKTLEQSLSKNQLASAKADAEELLGRPIINQSNLHKADF